MYKGLVILILLTNLLSTNCQEEELAGKPIETTNEGKPSYSFSYGVSDVRTGDVKSVWKSKDGDTVKGHYSVLEPDGSTRSVEYSVSPKTGFQAVVNADSESKERQGRSVMEDKAMMDYERYYDFAEELGDDYYEKKRTKHPYDTMYNEYSMKKQKYPIDSEPSEYTHTFSIKHPRDEASQYAEPESHVGFNFDPNCKSKKKKEKYNKESVYPNTDIDLKKKIHYSDPYKDNFEKYTESSHDFEKYINKYENTRYKPQKYEDVNVKPAASMKYTFPVLPPDMMPPEKYYPDDFPPRPKKKRPTINKYHYPIEEPGEYVWVPKRKLKNPTRIVESYDYREPEEEYESQYPRFEDAPQDDRFLSAIRGGNPPSGGGQKEVIRKVVKKRKPVFSLLDVLDI